MAAAATQPPQQDQPMQFAVVRGSSPSCEPVCPEWIWAEGKIEADSPARLKKVMKTLGNRKLPIVIQSPGGDVHAALEMGRMIRAKGLDVAVGYTTFSSCAPREKDCDAAKKGGYTGIAAAGFAYCYSACPMVLAAGARRLVGSWAELGVHQFTTTTTMQKVLIRRTTRIVRGKKVVSDKVISRKNAGTVTTTKMSPALRRQMETYLTEMGVGTDILDPINKTPAANILRLDQDEMLAMKLITGLDQVDVLTGPSICKVQPMPANCREVPANQNLAGKATTVSAVAVEPTGAQRLTASKSYANPVDAGRNKVDRVVLAELDSIGQMRFAVVRGSNPQCDPNCPEWISAEGRITSGTPERLRQLLETIGERQLPIVISSPGGDVLAAVAAGRLIRERNLDVAVARTRFAYCTPEMSDCAPDDGVFLGATLDARGECGSPCPLMLAGGVKRLVGPNARVTVQALGFGQRIVEYLKQMAVEPTLLPATQTFMVTQLTPDAMAAVRLTTSAAAVGEWTAPAICRSIPRPKNCRTVLAAQ